MSWCVGGEDSSGQLIFACDVVMEIAAGFGKEQSSRAGALLNRPARGQLTAHEPKSEGSGWDIEKTSSCWSVSGGARHPRCVRRAVGTLRPTRETGVPHAFAWHGLELPSVEISGRELRELAPHSHPWLSFQHRYCLSRRA